MSDVATPMQIENRLRELSKALDDAYREAHTAEFTYQRAKAEYEVAQAKALITSEGRNVSEREANAKLEVEDERRHLAEAEAQVRAFRANCERLRWQVDITRSQGRLVSSSMEV